MRIHIECENGEAKLWIEPIVALSVCYKLKPHRLNEIQRIVEKHKNEIIKKGHRRFSYLELSH